MLRKLVGRKGTASLLRAVLMVALVSVLGATGATSVASEPGSSTGSSHTSNWAVIVSTSRFWFNYRHTSNALSVYRTVKRLGIPDSQIILMLADDMVCDARNVFPGRIFAGSETGGRGEVNLYSGSDGVAEVDYRGYEVTSEAFIRVLAGRHDPSTPRSKRLLSDASSNVLVYMTGHGAEDIIKFQDSEELSGQDIADCLGQMHEQRRYNEILFVADTCHAASLQRHFYSPRVLAVSSASAEEDSISMPADGKTGVTLVDRFTHYLLEFFEKLNKLSGTKRSIADLFGSLSPGKIRSTVTPRTDLYHRNINEVPVTDFFGHVPRGVTLTKESY